MEELGIETHRDYTSFFFIILFHKTHLLNSSSSSHVSRPMENEEWNFDNQTHKQLLHSSSSSYSSSSYNQFLISSSSSSSSCCCCKTWQTHSSLMKLEHPWPQEAHTRRKKNVANTFLILFQESFINFRRNDYWSFVRYVLGISRSL